MSSPACQTRLGLWLLCMMSPGYAASPGIGLATADGSFQSDHSTVWGNATLFDGNLIETRVSSSQLHLTSGVNLRLAADSRARIYKSAMILEKGIGQLESGNYSIKAAGLQVAQDRPGTTARVQVTGSRRIVVAAAKGSVRVTNSHGVLIARLEEGREMSFEPHDQSVATKVSGILTLKNGKFILVDRVTNVTMQLRGDGLETGVGNLVEITGTVDAAAPTVPGASQLIDVISVKHLVNAAETATAAGAAGAAGGAAAGALAGISTGAMEAVVAGVAAAGTVGGLAAAHDLPGQGSRPPPTSR